MEVKKSNNYVVNWSDISPLGINLPDYNISHQSFTLEVTKQDEDYLYLVSCNYSTNELLEIDLSSSNSWASIGSHTDGFGNGHGFGVSQIGNTRSVILSRSTRLIRYNISNNSNTNLNSVVHVDVEDVIYHPYNENEVWLCTHGGVEKLTNNGTSF